MVRRWQPGDPVCQCDTVATRGYSLYYDSPDGCDIATKAMVTTRYGILAGMVISTYDVLMYSHPTGLSNLISRYMAHTIPLAAMGATFAVVANGAMLTREKNDAWNYFIGGVACGPILASYLGSRLAIVPASLFLGAVGVIKKTGVDENWTFFPHIQPHMNTVWGWRNDYTLAHDPKLDQVDEKCDKHDRNKKMKMMHKKDKK